jgi:hypothetical protein
MASTTSSTGSFSALVFPPDLRSSANYPSICYEIVKFRDRNYVVDTVTDESGTVTTSTPVDNSLEGSIIGDVIDFGIDKVTNVSNWLDRNFPSAFGGAGAGSASTETEPVATVTDPGEYERIAAAAENFQRLGAIYLPLPQAVNNQYDIGWRMAEMQLTEIARMAANSGNWRDALTNIVTGAYGSILGGIERNLGHLSPNPRKQAIFDSIDPRNFSFTHVFTPKSAEEAVTIDGIIQQLAYHALPDGSRTSALWQFPDEFKITFLNTKGFPQIGYCVCRNISIDYSSQGGLSIHDDGYPTQMTVTMSFMETDLRRKTSVGMQGMSF